MLMIYQPKNYRNGCSDNYKYQHQIYPRIQLQQHLVLEFLRFLPINYCRFEQ
jgi:hypothetical protein